MVQPMPETGHNQIRHHQSRKNPYVTRTTTHASGETAVTVATTDTNTQLEPIAKPETLAQFEALAVRIPESDDSQAYDDIISQILGATGVDGLNAPWDTSKAATLNGHRLRIESLTRRPSDHAEGLGIYLVIKGTDMGTGELFTLTIGSVAVLAQLAQIHALNGLPAIVELIVADKLTKNGYRPIHLKVLALSANS